MHIIADLLTYRPTPPEHLLGAFFNHKSLLRHILVKADAFLVFPAEVVRRGCHDWLHGTVRYAVHVHKAVLDGDIVPAGAMQPTHRSARFHARRPASVPKANSIDGYGAGPWMCPSLENRILPRHHHMRAYGQTYS